MGVSAVAGVLQLVTSLLFRLLYWINMFYQSAR